MVGTHGPGQVEYVWSRELPGSVHLEGEGWGVGLYLLIDILHTVNDVREETGIDNRHSPLHSLFIFLATCTAHTHRKREREREVAVQ